nr:hypothetical protein [Tanacetum cinerariifolium]
MMKEQVKVQVKVQVFKILPKIEKTVNEPLKAEVLTRSSNSLKTSYAMAADLSEMELKKILIEKMESNKSIHQSDVQMNLYKALVKAYESNKIILDTYGNTITLKRRCDDADKDEEPFVGSDRGSKRRRERKEPESTSAPKEKATKTTGKSTQGVADDQPIAEAFQHPEWFQRQKKPPTPDRAWNKTLPATHRSIQPWVSDLAKQADSRSSFNELMDTLVDFSAFLMNRLKVDTLTPELLVGPTYELMKGSCKSLCLRGGASSRKYTTFIKKTKAADYEHIKWIEDLVPRTMWSQELVRNDDKSDDQRMLCFQRLSKNVHKKRRHPTACDRSSTSDGTLNDVRTALDDRLKGIRMKYLPQAIWRKSDKERAVAVIQAIDKQLKMRRIM